MLPSAHIPQYIKDKCGPFIQLELHYISALWAMILVIWVYCFHFRLDVYSRVFFVCYSPSSISVQNCCFHPFVLCIHIMPHQLLLHFRPCISTQFKISKLQHFSPKFMSLIIFRRRKMKIIAQQCDNKQNGTSEWHKKLLCYILRVHGWYGAMELFLHT